MLLRSTWYSNNHNNRIISCFRLLRWSLVATVVVAWGVPSATTTPPSPPTDVSDPMSLAEYTYKQGGGCPFLVSKVDVQMWDVPILFNENDSRPIVLYSTETSSSGIVDLLMKHDSCRKDPRGNLRFAPLNSKVGDLLCRRMSESMRNEVLESSSSATLVICGPTSTYTKSNAALLIGRSLGQKWRYKPVRYLSLLSYVFPNRFRDRVYHSIVNVKNKMNKNNNNTQKIPSYDNEVYDQRFVDDSLLTYGEPTKKSRPSSSDENKDEEEETTVNRGDKVRIVWRPEDIPNQKNNDPTISYDDQCTNGMCLVGGTATVATVDLPLRIVVKIDRKSLGLGPDATDGSDIMYTWVKPSEVVPLL